MLSDGLPTAEITVVMGVGKKSERLGLGVRPYRTKSKIGTCREIL